MSRKLTVRFWGVRGSIPSPGRETVLVGGNTACVEVHSATTRVILDAGSGLRALGDALIATGEHRKTTLLLSHVHWDHVMGIPFFTPLYIPGCEITVASGNHGAPLRDLLHRQMSAPMFPVDLDAVGAKLTFLDLVCVSAWRSAISSLRSPSSITPIRSTRIGSSTAVARWCSRPTPSTSLASIPCSRGSPAAPICSCTTRSTRPRNMRDTRARRAPGGVTRPSLLARRWQRTLASRRSRSSITIPAGPTRASRPSSSALGRYFRARSPRAKGSRSSCLRPRSRASPRGRSAGQRRRC